jgi:hypothetical protein
VDADDDRAHGLIMSNTRDITKQANTANESRVDDSTRLNDPSRHLAGENLNLDRDEQVRRAADNNDGHPFDRDDQARFLAEDDGRRVDGKRVDGTHGGDRIVDGKHVGDRAVDGRLDRVGEPERYTSAEYEKQLSDYAVRAGKTIEQARAEVAGMPTGTAWPVVLPPRMVNPVTAANLTSNPVNPRPIDGRPFEAPQKRI